MGLPRFGHEIHAFNFYLASRHITTNPLVINHGNGKSSAGDFPASHVWLIDRHVCNYQPYFGMIIQTTKQYICTRPCHPPLPHPMGWVPYTAPIWDLPPPPPVVWCSPVVWWGCGTVPLPPCGVVGVWYGMLGMYDVYGRSGMFGMYASYGMYGMIGWYCMDGRYGM